MSPPPLTTYEGVLAAVGELSPAASHHERHVTWCGLDHNLGIAKNSVGQIEIFLVGPPLVAHSRLVLDSMQHHPWFRSDATSIDANRLVLPSLGHFQPVAAFICTELLRAGVDDDVEKAFYATESVIDLALQRLGLSSEVVLGLVGELILLRAMVLRAPDRATDLVHAWKGHTHSDRDFQIGSVGVEVKTTTHSTSSHRMHGIRQTQVGHAVGGEDEDALFLISVGLVTSDQGTTLPALVDDLCARLQRAAEHESEPVVNLLLERIKNYGSEDGQGYDHRDPDARATFSTAFAETFVRGYDMQDEAIRLFSDSDMVNRPFVDGDSLIFSLSLPDHVTGDLNPTTGRSNTVAVVLSRAGWV